ncbi:MAG: P22 coat protein - protein 5 domain protein, partial [Clostridia bacterium]|nr:P22 coat protein - protein 5 domain protein [Clostridia bacterium]
NSQILKNGKVGMYGNVTVKMSNNVYKSKTTADGDTDNIMMRTKRAVAFAKPLTHTEAYRPEKKFADAVKGFILFDAKVVRPKEMININVTY